MRVLESKYFILIFIGIAFLLDFVLYLLHIDFVVGVSAIVSAVIMLLADKFLTKLDIKNRNIAYIKLYILGIIFFNII